MRTHLLTLLLLFLCTFNGCAQGVDKDDPSILKLQNIYNEAIKICMKTEKLPWSSAVMISDATVNHILKAEFNAAERHLRAVDKESSMIALDSCIQFTIILNAFKSCPELSNVKINDYQALVKAIQDSRRKSPYPKIAMGMNSINTGSSIKFADYMIKNQIDELDIFFNNLNEFELVKEELRKLAKRFSTSEVRFQSFAGKGEDANKLICTFFDKSSILGQLKLSYHAQDYFGKIQTVEFVPQGKFINESNGPIAVESLR